MVQTVTHKTVDERVSNWIERLERLYAQLDEWAELISGSRVDRSSLEQVIEPLMRDYKVKPRKVPVYTIFVDKKYRIAFVPSAIWVVGANGRVNVTTNMRQHILVDCGVTDGASSDWQLVVDDSRKKLIPFDERAFHGLVQER